MRFRHFPRSWSGGRYKDDEGATEDANAQVSSGSPFVDGDAEPVTADFHLKAATDPGASLPAPFDLDPEATMRGADGNWDRGVFELVR